MNYRHAFHAGNFADVLKHVLLMMLVEHLKKKSSPLLFLDTHAERGVYDLSAAQPQRSGESIRRQPFLCPVCGATGVGLHGRHQRAAGHQASQG